MSNDRKPDHVAGLAIQIPQGMIEDTIRMQMIASIADPMKWVESIVRQACEEKVDSYGTKQTKFGKAIGDAIRLECEAVFKEWILQHKADIRDALMKELTRSHAKRIKEIAERLADGVAKPYTASIHLKIADGE